MLDVFGLTEHEQALYEHLLTRPPVRRADVDELCAAEGWDQSATALLDQLRRLGLIARIPSTPPRYAVVEPEPALDALLLARERNLAVARRRVTELATRFAGGHERREPDDLVDVVYGREAVLRRFEELQRGARAEFCAADAPPYATIRPGTELHPINDVELDLLARGIRYRVLYHPLGLDRPGRLADLRASIAAGEEARVTEVPLKLQISDQPMALLPLHRRPVELASALVIEDSTLLEALREMFELYWARAIPLRVRDGQPQLGDSARPTPTERTLLPLLVGGLNDGAIARQLGWSERTVRRHLRRMMVKLNVETRFQAGYQAVQRGWLGDG